MCDVGNVLNGGNVQKPKVSVGVGVVELSVGLQSTRVPNRQKAAWRGGGGVLERGGGWERRRGRVPENTTGSKVLVGELVLGGGLLRDDLQAAAVPGLGGAGGDAGVAVASLAEAGGQGGVVDLLQVLLHLVPGVLQQVRLALQRSKGHEVIGVDTEMDVVTSHSETNVDYQISRWS